MGSVDLRRTGDTNTNLYDGVFYCVECGLGIHVSRLITGKEKCWNCGGLGHISCVDFDIPVILNEYKYAKDGQI